MGGEPRSGACILQIPGHQGPASRLDHPKLKDWDGLQETMRYQNLNFKVSLDCLRPINVYLVGLTSWWSCGRLLERAGNIV
jgi:hypothetical protein